MRRAVPKVTLHVYDDVVDGGMQWVWTGKAVSRELLKTTTFGACAGGFFPFRSVRREPGRVRKMVKRCVKRIKAQGYQVAVSWARPRKLFGKPLDGC